MIWYLINIAIVTILWLSLDKQSEYSVVIGKRKSQVNSAIIFCFVASLLWILLSGFRDLSVGADTLAYKLYRFDDIKGKSWNSILESIVNRYIYNRTKENDLGYDVFQKLFQILSNNYQVYLVFVAICFFVPFGILVCKNSKNVYMSFILFSCLFFEFFAITGIRQTIATIFVNFAGYELIKRNKWFAYILVILLGATLHTSAICVLPFYWISKIKINKLTLSVYWVAIAASFVFRNQLLNLLKDIMSNDKYDTYNQYEGAGAGIFMYLLLAVGVVVTLFYKNLSDADGEKNRRIIHATLIACFFSSLLLINQSFMRVVQYYSIYLVLLLPELDCAFGSKRDKNIFRFAVCAVLVLLLIRKNPYYAFCFM